MPTYDTTTGLRALLGGNKVKDVDTGFLALAQDAALALATLLQEGVMDAGSFEVTQKAAGAELSVDVAAAAGRGAYVQDDSGTGLLVFVRPAGTTVNKAISAAHASLPRVDRVVLGLDGTATVLAGTATSGATLDNLTGAAAVPSSKLLLADVLVPATDTTISNNQIRDRRKWARGAFCEIVRNANAAASNDYSTAGTTLALVDSTNLQPRLELSGVPVLLTFCGILTNNTNLNYVYLAPQIDSVGINGQGSIGTNPGSTPDSAYPYRVTSGAGDTFMFTIATVFTPAAGSHLLGPAYAAGGGTAILKARAVAPLVLTIRELVSQDSRNNLTTTG